MYISIYIPWKSKGQTKHIVPRRLGVVRWNFTSKKWHCVDMHLTKNLGSSELRSSESKNFGCVKILVTFLDLMLIFVEMPFVKKRLIL